MRGMGLIVFALFLDGFQAAITLSFTGIFLALGVIPFVGVVVGPLGIVVGFVISTCLSLVMGAALVTLLLLNGMFYPRFLLPGGITELIPALNLLPTWTTVTILSIIQKNKEEGGKVGAAASIVTAIAKPSVQNVANAAPTPRLPSRVDGIQPPQAANNNYAPQPQRYAA